MNNPLEHPSSRCRERSSKHFRFARDLSRPFYYAIYLFFHVLHSFFIIYDRFSTRWPSRRFPSHLLSSRCPFRTLVPVHAESTISSSSGVDGREMVKESKRESSKAKKICLMYSEL